MQHHQMLIIFALLILAFGLFSRLAERNSVTGPMFFMTVGILASFSGVLEVTHDLGPVKLVAELALMLVLFIDASLIDFGALAYMQAVFGQLYVAILVAGLVSAYISSRQSQ